MPRHTSMRQVFVVTVMFALACTAKDVAGPGDAPGDEQATPTPAQLAFTVQPDSAEQGATLSPGVQVTVQDADGNVVTSATNQVTMALESNPTGTTLGGTTQVMAVGGVATFDDLSIDASGAGYTLSASATGLVGDTSGAFDVRSPLLSIDEREVAFTAVQDLMATLPGDDIDADKQALMDLLSARSEFDEVGITAQGTIFAIFTDGVPYFIMDNHTLLLSPDSTAPVPPFLTRPLDVAPVTLPNITTRSFGYRPRQQAAPMGPSGIPKALKFRILNGFGDLFNDTDPSDEIRQMLLDKGYLESGGSNVATVETLRGVGADAVLYFRSHGGNAILNRPGNPVVDGLWTATPTTAPEPPAILDDLLKRRLGYATEYNSLKWGGEWKEQGTHYMITAEFIRLYWGNFGENSFVYFDGCWGATMGSIQTALIEKNVSVFASWTNVSRAGPNGQTAQYVFDRLLGANQFEPEDPAQRPFDYEAIEATFGTTVKHGHDEFPSSTPGKPPITPSLSMIKLQGEFGVLAPSIRNVQVDEQANEMTVDGIFGKDPGPSKREVTIEGTTLTVKTWGEREIVLSGLDPTAAGYVMVKVLGHESNAAPLTRWEGPFTYTVDLGQLWAPTLTQQVACDLHFRADVRGYRDEPGPVLIVPKDTLFPTQSSTCEFAMFGSGQDGGENTYVLTGGGPMMTSDGQSTPVNFFTATGLVDVATKKITMSLVLGAQGALTITPPTGPAIDLPSQLIADLETLWGDASCPPTIPPVGFDFQMVSSGGFAVSSGTRSGTGPCGITNIPNSLQWGAIPAAFPPKPIDGR